MNRGDVEEDAENQIRDKIRANGFTLQGVLIGDGCVYTATAVNFATQARIAYKAKSRIKALEGLEHSIEKYK